MSARRDVTLRDVVRFLELQNLGLNLPFLLGFVVVASGGLPSARTTSLIVVAFVAARNAGHAFNRWIDRDLDARNPRTADRLLARRPDTAPWGLAVAAANAAVLVVAAYFLSPLAFELVPIAVVLVLAYSVTKRLSSLTTVFLGVVEAITPAAAFAAVQNALPLEALVASFALLSWGTAFETVHSLGDLASDEALSLESLPRRLGVSASSHLVLGAHALALTLLGLFGAMAQLRVGYFVGLGGMALGVVLVDSWVVRDPFHARRPFRAHFVLSAVFLAACLLGVFGPGFGTP